MKRAKTNLTMTFFFLLLLAVEFMGCGSGDDDYTPYVPSSDPYEAILGTWVNLGTYESPYLNRGETAEFYSDGTMKFIRKDLTQVGRYTIREATEDNYASAPYILSIQMETLDFIYGNQKVDNYLDFYQDKMVIISTEPVGISGQSTTEFKKKMK